MLVNNADSKCRNMIHHFLNEELAKSASIYNRKLYLTFCGKISTQISKKYFKDVFAWHFLKIAEEKKKDIASLKSMGATNQLIKQIFVAEGFMLSAFGLILGCILAFLLIYLQQEYSLVQLSGSGDFIIDAYPVELRFSDLIQVVLIVLGIGTAAAWIPASRASKVSSVLRKD